MNSNSTDTRWHNSIQAMLSVILLLITTLIFAGFMFVYYKTTSEEMDRELGALADFFSNHLSMSLVKPLWDMDSVAVEGIMTATMDEKQVYAIHVRDNLGNTFGKTRNKKWECVDAAEQKELAGQVKREKRILKENEAIGSLEISLTAKFMRAKLNEAIRKMVYTLVALNVLLYFALFFSIKNIIIMPIKATASYLRRISGGDIPERIAERYKGEFNEIRNNLNILIGATNETILAAESIASGNLNIDVGERSENDRMMKALNRMIGRLKDILNETDQMIRAVGKGKLGIRGQADAFEGGWRDLVAGVNELIDGLSKAVSTATAVSMEMELAKKIQTVLLPDKPRISGYEIRASCEPADEVGGDYYDVISVGGFDWIVVGDVSGHGVTSGLIMMMVQTSIHTVLLGNPHVKPTDLLTAVNKAIYRNIRKMDEIKHMTIVVLAAGKNGDFKFTGLHEDILIRRADTGEVETVQTDGMWIGLEPDICDMQTENKLRLNPGDCMVLFTDGIIEAWKSDHNMYGETRLVNIIRESGHKSASEIHDDILESLKSYERPDDVTLLVIKRV